MALARLASMPAELKLETYYHLDFSDLLALSHVSRFWRAFVLGDRRWSTWFNMIVNPETNERVEKILSRLQSTNIISARTIVNLCFSTKCSICSAETTDLFLPLLKRICHACLDPEEHAVISLSAGLTAFDLNEKDITPDIVILQCDATHSRNTFTKLVSKSAMHALYVAGFPSYTQSPAPNRESFPQRDQEVRRPRQPRDASPSPQSPLPASLRRPHCRIRRCHDAQRSTRRKWRPRRRRGRHSQDQQQEDPKDAAAATAHPQAPLRAACLPIALHHQNQLPQRPGR
ncbi:hypothetical protein C8R46DRAFT_375406 [Mycena filopes]|nr:hypothetical protein C8R46DRAFT_375406 [Mycena filopes]